MAGSGHKVRFHGAFGSKAKARRKEKLVKHSYIERKRFKRLGLRYLVLTRRKGK